MKDVVKERLSDQLAVGMLAWAYPPEMIERAIRRSGRLGVRNRLLPPQIMVYFVLVMCLFPHESYEDVARLLAEGLSMANPGGSLKLREIPSTAAVSRARMRLGVEPLKELFADDAGRSPSGTGEDTRYRGWRLRSLDGRVIDVREGGEAGAGERRPSAGKPADLRISVLAEGGTGLPLAAEILPTAPGGRVATDRLLSGLGLGDLLVTGGEYACPGLLHSAVAKGVDLLWGMPERALPGQPLSRLPDGSRLYALPDPSDPDTPAASVRVLDEAPGTGPRLATTFLDPAVAPARELRGVYAGRWTFGSAANQLQAFRKVPKKALRSRSPEMIEQELWGYLLLYRAMWKLAHNRLL